MKQFKRKVCIVNGNGQYVRMFLDMGWEITTQIENADLVQFTGGEDVNPALYGEKPHPQTGYRASRDAQEEIVYKECRAINKPMAGICRGGQFLNVMCGGKLFQHVNGHAIAGTHEATDMATGRIVQVTSTHHQMMRKGPTGKVLAFAQQSGFRHHVDSGEVVNVPWTIAEPDVEVVHYPEHLVLCFQPHPEYGYTECRDYYFELLNRCLGL